MGIVWQSWGHVITAALFALPPAALIVTMLVRWRNSRGEFPVMAWRYSLAEVGGVLGTLPWLWMVLTPKPGASQVELIPLRDLLDQLGGKPVPLVVQVSGNLLVLAAFGTFLPVRFPRMARMHRVAIVAATVSVTIELLQYALQLGRVTSVDDVLLNTAGALAGAALSRRWWAAPRPGDVSQDPATQERRRWSPRSDPASR